MRCVLDTNVLVAALRSKSGASNVLLSAVGTGSFEHVVTVPLVLQYEDVLVREESVPGLARRDALTVVDFVAASAVQVKVHYLWRPHLRDPGDDMVLEAAIAGGAPRIVTFNLDDFKGSERVGVEALTPGVFLRLLRDTGRLAV